MRHPLPPSLLATPFLLATANAFVSFSFFYFFSFLCLFSLLSTILGALYHPRTLPSHRALSLTLSSLCAFEWSFQEQNESTRLVNAAHEYSRRSNKKSNRFPFSFFHFFFPPAKIRGTEPVDKSRFERVR